MQKIAEARRMSKNIISAILLATVIACLRHSHQQQNEMLAAHKDMITKHKEMLKEKYAERVPDLQRLRAVWDRH